MPAFGESERQTPYAVVCRGDVHPDGWRCNDGDLIYLTEEMYQRQMDHPDYFWKCPRCRGNADWDDANYEIWMDSHEPPGGWQGAR